MNRYLACRGGFTLLEIIVTLTILSVLGVIVYQFMSSSLIRSAQPFSVLAKTFVLREVAENITADYLQNIPRNVPALKTSIGAEGSQHINNGYCPAAPPECPRAFPLLTAAWLTLWNGLARSSDCPQACVLGVRRLSILTIPSWIFTVPCVWREAYTSSRALSFCSPGG